MEISLQKKAECDAIQNLLPYINERLNLNIIKIKEAHLSEKPDFIFSNGKYTTIGIEVVECHPSVQRSRKYNKASSKGFQDDVCKALLNSQKLKSYTEKQKINIIINRYSLFKYVYEYGIRKKTHIKKKEFVEQVETILEKWYTEGYMCETDNIKQLKIIKTVGKNIVQFNNVSRRDPIKWANVKYSILEKNKKVEFYKKENKCDEYWLCIYIPFEESRQSNEIDYNETMDEVAAFIGASPFDHIFLTSVMPNDGKTDEVTFGMFHLEHPFTLPQK